MILKINNFFIRTYSNKKFLQFSTIKQPNYYAILGVQSGATDEQIRQAYAKTTKNINIELNQNLFKKTSQAFVILTNLKARDAYDSLIKPRKTSYLEQEVTAPIVKNRSYLAQRKKQATKNIGQMMNIDKFGRYRGGLPNRKGFNRGSALNEPGQLYTSNELQQMDRNPDFSSVDTEISTSFKEYHQDERQARTMKWPWKSLVIEYDYFTFKSFRKIWPYLQAYILFFILIPTLVSCYQRRKKKAAHLKWKNSLKK